MAKFQNLLQWNSAMFTHDKAKKALTAELSTLGYLRFENLYDDACDVGIAIRNHKINSMTMWMLVDTIDTIERDGEVLGWNLLPAPGEEIRCPALKGYKMVIFND
jgi:hypothetical protein